MSDDVYTVRSHILRKDVDTDRDQVAVATVDGIAALIVPVSEERARGLIGTTSFEGMEARLATVEEIGAVWPTTGWGPSACSASTTGRGSTSSLSGSSE